MYLIVNNFDSKFLNFYIPYSYPRFYRLEKPEIKFWPAEYDAKFCRGISTVPIANIMVWLFSVYNFGSETLTASKDINFLKIHFLNIPDAIYLPIGSYMYICLLNSHLSK